VTILGATEVVPEAMSVEPEEDEAAIPVRESPENAGLTFPQVDVGLREQCYVHAIPLS
jgi:hypothetical protein